MLSGLNGQTDRSLAVWLWHCIFQTVSILLAHLHPGALHSTMENTAEVPCGPAGHIGTAASLGLVTSTLEVHKPDKLVQTVYW